MPRRDEHEQRPLAVAVEDDLLAVVIRSTHAIRKRTRSVLVIAVFAVVLGGMHCVWRMQSPAVYETTAEFAVVVYAPELRGVHRFLVTADPVLKETVERLPETLRRQWKTLSPEQQIARIRDGLTASFRHGTNNVLQLSYRSAHPETGSAVLNALIAAYTDFVASHVIGRRWLLTYRPDRPKTGTVALNELIGAYTESIASQMIGRQRLPVLSRPASPGSIRPEGLGVNEFYVEPIRLPTVPSQPIPFRWWRILAAWTFLGLLVSLGHVFVREMIDRIGSCTDDPTEAQTDSRAPASRAA